MKVTIDLTTRDVKRILTEHIEGVLGEGFQLDKDKLSIEIRPLDSTDKPWLIRLRYDLHPIAL